MSASQELEKSATNFALEAVRLDKQGAKGMAITTYQKAIESLLQLVQLYPEYSLNKVYIQRAIAYQERIKAIQGAVTYSEPRPEARCNGVEGETKTEGGKSTYEELCGIVFVASTALSAASKAASSDFARIRNMPPATPFAIPNLLSM